MPLAGYPLRAKISKVSEGTNTTGNPGEEFELYADNVPAWYESLREKELWEARAVFGETVARIRLRYSPDLVIKQGMKVEMDGREFRVAAPPDNKYLRNRETVLTVKEVI